MRLNPKKCNYMVFSRSEEQFATRLKIEETKLDRVSEVKLLGLYLTDDLSWSRNCKEICIKAYSRLQMITKLKYVGVQTEDLLDVYKLYIRSITEYCSVAFHSSLTVEQSEKIERIQKTCVRVILGEMYIDYRSALEMCGLDTLPSRRVKRCLDFALKCSRHPRNSRLFPLNDNIADLASRKSEKYLVNFAKGKTYQRSTIPYCQRLLNAHYSIIEHILL